MRRDIRNIHQYSRFLKCISSNALASHFGKPCDIFCYEEHSLKKGSDSSAIAYVGITGEDGKNYFGIGIDHDIIRASIDALESAMNRSLEA